MHTQSPYRNNLLLPLIMVYVIFSILIYVFRDHLSARGVDTIVLQGGHSVILLATILASLLRDASGRQTTGAALLKGLYGGFLARFFLIALSAFIYILWKRKQVNLPGLAGGAIFYVLYSVLDIRLMRNSGKSSVPHA